MLKPLFFLYSMVTCQIKFLILVVEEQVFLVWSQIRILKPKGNNKTEEKKENKIYILIIF